MARATRIAIFAAAAVAAGAPAEAQPAGPFVPPRAGEALREATAPRPDVSPLGPAPDIRFTSQTPPSNAAELRFTLTDLQVEGGTTYAEDELRPLWTELIGTEISLEQVFALAAALQQRYRDDGYLFTRVVVPAQRIEGGVARLEVIEAVIVTAEIEEPDLPLGPVRELAERIVAPLRGLENPTLADVEAVLLLLNDIPGVTRAAAVPRLGTERRGAVELYINMERKPIDLALFADNRQSPIIGPGLVGGVLSLNSWSPAGDSTELSFFDSIGFEESLIDELRERWTFQIEHRRFVTDWGLQARGRALFSNSLPGDIVRQFDIQSDQKEFGLYLDAPLRRTRALSATLTFAVERIEVNSLTPPAAAQGQALVVRDRITVASLALEASQRDAWGLGDARLELRRGLDVFGRSSRAGDPDLSRNDGDGEFWSIKAELSRSLALPWNFTLWGQGWGQWADRPLLAYEEFTAGGPQLGRAYHPSEISGDQGIGAVVELRWNETAPLGDWQVPVELYVFADGAEVRNLNGGAPVHASIISTGVGIRAQFPGALAINLEAAKPINRPLAYDQTEDWRFLFSAVKEF